MNENIEMKTCPGCGRHCDLSDPHCGRGREYAKTGVLPERKHEHEHGEGHPHGPHYKRYEDADLNGKLMINLQELGHMMRFKHDGKGGQMRILRILSENEIMTQRTLTEQLGIQPGSASEVIAKLENAGFITRALNEKDHRTADITLTDAGRQAVAQGAEAHKKRRYTLFAALSEEEKQTLLGLLEKVRGDWEKRFHEEGHHHGPRGGHGHHHHERKRGE